MERVRSLLLAGAPEQRFTGIVHGDYRFGNVMVDPATGSVRAVLDWELCTLGDVLADVGYVISYWTDPGEPFRRENDPSLKINGLREDGAKAGGKPGGDPPPWPRSGARR